MLLTAVALFSGTSAVFGAVRYLTQYALVGLKVRAGKIIGDGPLPPPTPKGNSFIYLHRAARKELENQQRNRALPLRERPEPRWKAPGTERQELPFMRLLFFSTE